MKIFLHIGARKCASSSIQQHFSYNNIQGKFAYGVIDPRNGNILLGDDVKAKALISAADYSCSSGDIFINPENLHKSLEECAKKYDTLLLSQEGWTSSSDLFYQNKDIFEEHEVEILFIIRPYVQWYNSAWWQWRNWEKNIDEIDFYIRQDTDIFTKKHIGGGCSWLKNYLEYKQLPFVKKVHLLSLQTNIIEQLYFIMNLEYEKCEVQQNNVSSSMELLSVLSSNKNLRPVHDPRIEFTINKYIKKRSPTPWVLSEENIRLILERTKSTCIELAKIIENENILEKPLWWDISAYKDKIVHYSRDISLSEEVQEDLLEEANALLVELEKNLNYNKKSTKLDTIGLLYKKIETIDAEIRTRNLHKTLGSYANKYFENESKINQKQNIANRYAPKLLQGFVGNLVINYLKFSFIRFKILSEVTFGQKRKMYRRKKLALKELIENLNDSLL